MHVETNAQEDAMEILRQLEDEAITVEEAMDKLTGNAESAAVEQDSPQQVDHSKHDWWLILLGLSLGVTGLGIWLATIGGWWWLLAAPLLLTGPLALLITVASLNSPWVHVRVKTGSMTWPRTITIRLPVPLRLASWVLRRFGGHIPGLDRTAIDELLMAIEETVTGHQPISIFVRADDNGEHVEVYLG
ncbi:MAG: hypothetical protein PVJ07_09115 [Anaerolineales bacterium]|jgi:hypothetical protein